MSVVRELSAHPVRCPACTRSFELFSSEWCSHAEPSKRCPHCERCACGLPGYEDPRLFAAAPPAFERRGFRRLFVAYL